FGISLPSDEEIITVRTDCICCDSELRHKWPRETHSDSAGGMPRRSAIPLVASIAGIAAGVIVLDFLYPESEVLAYALPALLAGMATSLLIALIRARKLMAAVRR